MKQKMIKKIVMLSVSVLMLWQGICVGAAEYGSDVSVQSVSGGDVFFTAEEGITHTIHGIKTNETYIPPVVIVANPGYEFLKDGQVLTSEGISLWTEGSHTVTFQVRRCSDGVVSNTVELNFVLKDSSMDTSQKFIDDLIDLGIVIDRNAPAGTITVADKSWSSFQMVNSFQDYAAGSYAVTISGSDDYSGVNKIEYVISANAYVTVEALQSASLSWQEYSEEYKPIIRENSNQVVYARISDKAGNMTYISTEGIHIKAQEMSTSKKEESVKYTEGTKEEAQAVIQKSPKTGENFAASAGVISLLLLGSSVYIVKLFQGKMKRV